jgi:hypothetical protein
MIDGNCGGKHAGSRTAWLPKALWIAVLAVLLSLPLEAAAEDEMHGQQKNKNYAVAPIVVSNPTIGTGAGATGMFFYDVGSGGWAAAVQCPAGGGLYPYRLLFCQGLLNSLHLFQDQGEKQSRSVPCKDQQRIP